VGLLSIIAGWAFAAEPDAPINASANWLFSVAEPSASPDTAMFRDFQVLQVSDTSAAAVSPSSSASANENTAAPNLQMCCPETAWCFSFGGLYLQRSRSRPATIITPPTGTPGRILEASDFSYSYDACPDFQFMCQLPSGYLLDGRFFSDHATGSDFDVGTLTTFRMAGIGITILGGGPVFATEETKLDNMELNFHVPVRAGCTVFTGLRYLELRDTLDVVLVNTLHNRWDEENHMFGVQGGLDYDFFSPGSRLQFNGIIKAGAYGNTGTNHFTSAVVSSTTDSKADTAFVGEIDFTASYQLTKHLAVRGGYMVMWIEGVGLAPDTAATTFQAAGGTHSPINTNCGLWYNGATASLDFTW
jgi:hypothetical protein